MNELQTSYLERIAIALEGINDSIAILLGKPQPFAEHTPESDPDYLAAVAAEVEGRIQDGATPKVGRAVKMEEDAIDSEPEEGMWIDLFKQPRRPLIELALVAPKDILITEASESENKLFVAALEIVYSNLAPDQWGSDRAKQHIADLIKLHKEET